MVVATIRSIRLQLLPPLFVYEIENKYNLTKILHSICHLPPICTHGKNYLKIKTFSQADEKTIGYCTQKSIQFATEPSKRDRPLKLVIRKLPIDTLTGDIKQSLIELGFPVANVTQLYGRDKSTYAKVLYQVFLVTLLKTADKKAF